MSKFGKYMAAPDRKDEPPKKSAIECLVNGCPLPGVYRLKDDESICCVHDEQDPSKWAEQTTRIRNRGRLFGLALKMTNAEPGAEVTEEVIERVRDLDGPPPKIHEKERMTVRLYGAQLKGYLVRECRGPRDKVPEPVKTGMKHIIEGVPF